MKYDIALNPLNLNIDYYIFSDKCETSSKKKKHFHCLAIIYRKTEIVLRSSISFIVIKDEVNKQEHKGSRKVFHILFKVANVSYLVHI